MKRISKWWQKSGFIVPALFTLAGALFGYTTLSPFAMIVSDIAHGELHYVWEVFTPDFTFWAVSFTKFGAVIGLVLGLMYESLRRKNLMVRRAKEFIELVLDSMEEGVVTIGADYRVVSANRSFARTARLERREVVGRTCYEVSHGACRPCETPDHDCPIRDLKTTGRSAKTVHKHVDRFGTARFIELTAYPLRGESGEAAQYIEISRDITEQRRAEQELKRSAEELRRSNKDLESFAYIASHDLQEPLRMVSSYVQLLKKRYEGQLDAGADEFIRYAVDGAQRMHRIINDLLAYSRVSRVAAPFVPIDATHILEQVTESLRRAIDESGAMITYDPLPVIRGDETLLAQLLQNLLGNAIKFRNGEGPKIHIRAQREGAWWAFEVADNGIGIDPQYCEKIFQMFQRLNGHEYPGTGMGLAICRRIVDHHGGRIWVESDEANGGTRFFFTLPDGKRDASEIDALPSAFRAEPEPQQPDAANAPH
jgi:PAS domain S-box-containing protein